MLLSLIKILPFLLLILVLSFLGHHIIDTIIITVFMLYCIADVTLCYINHTIFLRRLNRADKLIKQIGTTNNRYLFDRCETLMDNDSYES